MEKNNNWSLAVCGVVLRENSILLVRHTYGSAKGKLLTPGGFVQNGEMPEAAAVREVFEETGVVAEASAFLGIRFQQTDWYAIFLLNYVSGEPKSDGAENDFAAFVPLSEAAVHPDVTNLSRLMSNAAINGFAAIPLNEYYSGDTRSNYMLYGLDYHKG